VNEPQAPHVTARQSFYAPQPTRWTLFLRTFVPWQLFRFAWINLKMVDMIRISHRARGRTDGGAD